MKPDNKAGGPWLYALGLVPVIWFALLIAPAISGGLKRENHADILTGCIHVWKVMV